MIRVCSLFSIFSFMGIRSVRGAVFVVLAVAALAFMAYRFAVYSSPAQKQAMRVKEVEKEIQIVESTIDSLHLSYKECVARFPDTSFSVMKKLLRAKEVDAECGSLDSLRLYVRAPYYSRRDSLRHELNRSKRASKR